MSKKVVSLKDKKAQDRAEVQRTAKLHAEVLGKDYPSEEARKFFDASLDTDPDAWRRLGDLTKEAAGLAFNSFWLGYATKASVLKGAELLKAELGYDEAAPTIKLLIEQAVLCYIRQGMVEHIYSRRFFGASYTLRDAAHWEMRLTLCQRRYMRALTTLAKVRGLLARAELAEAHAAMKRPHSMKVLKAATG
jgi:hypothetical protein